MLKFEQKEAMAGTLEVSFQKRRNYTEFSLPVQGKIRMGLVLET